VTSEPVSTAASAHALGCVEKQHAPRRGQEAALGRLRVHPRLDGVAADLGGRLDGSPGGDVQLLGDEVETGDLLGDGMLDLQPGVHLDEEHLAHRIRLDEELDGAGAHVIDAARGCDGGVEQAGAHVVRQVRGGRLLDHLLMTTLQGALALAEGDDVAVRVAEDLHLDVPGPLHEALEHHRVIAEGGRRDPAGRGECGRQLVCRAHDLHALAATAGARLDEQRVADVLRPGADLVVVEARCVEPGNHRDAVPGHVLSCARLVAHDLEGAFARPDEDHAGGLAGSRQRDAFGEEPVARVDGLGAGRLDGRHDRIHVQVRLGSRRAPDVHGVVRLTHVRRQGVGVAVHGDAAHPLLAQGADDAAGDLAAVRHEDGIDSHADHIRKRPKRGSGRGVRETTSRASPSRSRVRSGSMIPSSHSRAVA